jgi:hypothetical protein
VTTSDLTAIWSSDAYRARIAELEAEGLTTSDAQGEAALEDRFHPSDCVLCGTDGDHVYVSPERAARTAAVKRYLDSLATFEADR